MTAPTHPFMPWTGEVSDYASAFEALQRSLSFEVSGMPFSVPARSDYEQAFRAESLIGDSETLADHRELIAAAQAHWHSDGNNACVFAAHMSSERARVGWETYVLADHGDPAADAGALHTLWSNRILAPEAEVVSVLIPHADDVGHIVGLLRRLEQLPSWAVTDEGQEEDDEFGTVQRLGLRVDVEFGFSSEVLGFGPYAAYGYTRRAPFTELALRAKAPRKRPKHRRAFMAQVMIPGLDTADFGNWWEQTKASRAARVGAEHNDRAKARVAFALPLSAWHEETT